MTTDREQPRVQSLNWAPLSQASPGRLCGQAPTQNALRPCRMTVYRVVVRRRMTRAIHADARGTARRKSRRGTALSRSGKASGSALAEHRMRPLGSWRPRHAGHVQKARADRRAPDLFKLEGQ